jgi:hypothetical protein
VAAWTVSLKESVIHDLRALGRKQGRAVLKAATEFLYEHELGGTGPTSTHAASGVVFGFMTALPGRLKLGNETAGA